MDDPTLSRRDVLKVGALGAAALSLPFLPGPLAAKRAGELKEGELPRPYTTAFALPPDLTPTGSVTVGGRERPLYVIEQRQFQARILPRFQTTMWGYNGTFPGPTIRAVRGTPIVVRQINKLPQRHPILRHESTTSTHLHGAPSLPQYDGYANDLMRPGQYKDYLYDNMEEERTIWYHDHAVHHTTENVYSGLAGLYITRNAAEGQLPSGRYDVPLVISDAAFTKSGQLLFEDHSESGLAGDVILVNGKPWPVLRVERRQYRFRVLIASLGRGYKLQLSPAAPMTVVATDGGLVPEPQPVTTLTAGMAERYEIVIDFSRFRIGQRVELRNLGVDNAIDYDHTNKVMAFQVVAEASAPDPALALPPIAEPALPEKPLMQLTAADAVRTRRLRFERQGGEWTIDRKTWADVEASGFRDVLANPRPGDVELWELENNSGGWFHPIHLHLVDFKILDRDGRPPEPYERGPKDVVYLGENETVRIIARFGGAFPQPNGELVRRTGRYMIHCHNTSHEDHDMMSQFRVGADDPANDPLSDPPKPWPPAASGSSAASSSASPSPSASSSPAPSSSSSTSTPTGTATTTSPPATSAPPSPGS
ncbi:multicopper oxidase family protein [Geodermatophilus sabuli]|uniref:Multicopper oxidase family protein n=1 Tax=Geodermatophilus sabuli TaxID=1564158 RepID=A0A7K3W1K3_9ACTN|nr:multicopper oxidase family protein [Geodermatophilus sabuli]NEK58756.1 multicopper oxidase family protein [Geodermatophilus sabuli]